MAYSSFLESGRENFAREILLEISRTSFTSSGVSSIANAVVFRVSRKDSRKERLHLLRKKIFFEITTM